MQRVQSLRNTFVARNGFSLLSGLRFPLNRNSLRAFSSAQTPASTASHTPAAASAQATTTAASTPSSPSSTASASTSSSSTSGSSSRRLRPAVTSAQLRAQRPRATEKKTVNPDSALDADKCGPEQKAPEMVDVVNPKTGERLGPRGLEPTRFGDWEAKGRCWDF